MPGSPARFTCPRPPPRRRPPRRSARPRARRRAPPGRAAATERPSSATSIAASAISSGDAPACSSAAAKRAPRSGSPAGSRRAASTGAVRREPPSASSSARPRIAEARSRPYVMPSSASSRPDSIPAAISTRAAPRAHASAAADISRRRRCGPLRREAQKAGERLVSESHRSGSVPCTNSSTEALECTPLRCARVASMTSAKTSSRASTATASLIVEEGLLSSATIELLRERFGRPARGRVRHRDRARRGELEEGSRPHEDRTRQICNGWRADDLDRRAGVSGDHRPDRRAAGWYTGTRMLQGQLPSGSRPARSRSACTRTAPSRTTWCRRR